MRRPIRLKLIGITDHIIEKIYTIDHETSLEKVLREAMRDNMNLVEKISELLLNGRFLLIINGLTVHRFSDIGTVTINPGDEIAIMPVVFGGCKQI